MPSFFRILFVLCALAATVFGGLYVLAPASSRNRRQSAAHPRRENLAMRQARTYRKSIVVMECFYA